MDAIQAVLLALIQGLTEFLPISSSAHLILPAQLLGWVDQGLAFDVAVHVGSLLAVVIYFRQDITNIIMAWCRSLNGPACEDSRLGWYIIWATVPAGLVGLLLNEFIETHLRSVAVIAATTLIFGLLLGIADKRSPRRQSLSELSFKQALLIGCAQALALIPGTSRSGVTMTAALFLGLTRQAAARFSFLLSVPIIALSGGFKGLELVQTDSLDWQPVVWGTIISFTSAITTIHLFLKWIDRAGMMPFVIYRVLLALVLLAFIDS